MGKLLLLILTLNPFALEWNCTWRTDVPYEVAIDFAKLNEPQTGMIVYANGKAVNTVCLADPSSKVTKFRFNVPAGTKTLAMKPGKCFTMQSDAVDNIFANGEWTADGNVRITKTEEGLLFESTNWSSGIAKCRVPVPVGAAGKPVSFEMDAVSKAGMSWASTVYMQQYDGEGELITEHVYDARWTTLVRPAGKFVPSREYGFIHPQAKSLEMVINLRPGKPRYDDYGLKIKNPEVAKPKLLMSRFALRTAANIPFPSLRSSFWAPGVSGEEGDEAFTLDPDRCFWYVTRSMAAWSQGIEVRKEEDMFFPVNSGTMEVWVKPEWEKGSKQRMYIFDAGNNMSIAGHPTISRITRGSMVAVSYVPATGDVKLELRDCKSKVFQKECKAEIPDRQWNHIAVTWTPGAAATLYINGKKVMDFSLEGFVPLQPETDEYPNDNYAMAVYLGSDYKHARPMVETERQLQKYKFLTGCIDLLRVSSTERYGGDFTPAKHFTNDKDTRALFDFNRSIDGVSGGGIGWISGSVRAYEDILEHKFGQIQYYPEKLLDKNNPKLVLHPRITVTPSDKDLSASFRTEKVSFDLKTGGTKHLDMPEGVITDYVEIKNNTNEVLLYPVILNNDDIDARSYGDIAESLDVDNATDEQKVNRIFNFLLETSDYFCNHQITFDYGSDKPYNTEYSALKMLNSYCGFECGPLNNLCMSLFANSAKCATNMTYGNGHSFEEVFFDGQNHIYDLSPQTFFPAMNNESNAGLRESEVEPGAHFRLGASCDHMTRLGTRRLNPNTINFPEKFAMSLNPGEAIRFWTSNEGVMNDLQVKTFAMLPVKGEDKAKETHAEETKMGIYRVDRFFPEYANAFLTFDGVPEQGNPAFTAVETNSFCYSVRTCYPIVAAEYEAVLANGKKASLEISTDLGKTFRPFTSPATYAVRARHGYLIRVNAPIASVKHFRAVTELQTNRRILTGLLRDGSNDVRLKANGGNGATITYQYRTEGKEISFGKAVKWGAYKGFEQNLVLFSDNKKLEIPVDGITKNATVKVKGDLEAKLSNGKLTLTSKSSKQRFAWVTVTDGKEAKTLTVLISPNSRLERTNAEFFSKNDSETINFDSLASGDYAVFSLMRFPVSVQFPHRRTISIKFGDEARYNAGSPINQRFDYLKDIIGPDGGRGIWRWDTALIGKKHYSMWPLKTFKANNTSSIEYFFDGVDGPVELQAVLIIPEPSTEFLCEIAKNLFGRNHRPYTIEQ